MGTREVWVMEDRNNNNALMEITGEVTAVEENRYVEVKLSSAKLFDGVASYRLTDLGNGRTRMESAGKYYFKSAFATLMTPLVMPSAKKKMDNDLGKLKSLIEAEPAPAAQQVSTTAQ